MNLKKFKKTRTGLYVIHKGKRVDVYSLGQLEKLQQQSIFNKLKRAILRVLKKQL